MSFNYVHLALILTCGFSFLPSTTANIKFNYSKCDNASEISAAKYLKSNDEIDLATDFYSSLSGTICTWNVSSCQVIFDIRNVSIDFICNETIKCNEITPCDLGCPTHYKCKNESCTKRRTLCDNLSQEKTNARCEEDDGWDSGVGFKCLVKGKKCRIPQQLLYDEIADCDDAADLCYSSHNPVSYITNRDIRSLHATTFNQSHCFKCFDGSMIIPLNKVCDDVIDCSDLSDECLCEGKFSNLCDKASTCSDLHYKKFFTKINSKADKKCDLGQVRCPNSKCINRSSICDSTVDCLDGIDENFEECQGTLKCYENNIPKERSGEKCRCEIKNRNLMGTLCDDELQCPDPQNRLSLKSNEECHPWCPYRKKSCDDSGFILAPNAHTFIDCLDPIQNESKPVYFWNICDNKADCPNLKDEINCIYKFHCFSKGLVNIENYQKCDGLKDCDNGSDEYRATCPDRFFCSSQNDTIVSLDKKSVCDFVINCKDKSDEKNCTDTRFYCENQTPLFVRSEMVFDGFADCSDGSDECPVSITDVLSSKHQLIANPILRVFLWIAALMALIGNSIVIWKEARIFRGMLKRKSSCSLKTYHILLLNLAVADFLMGIYLLMLGIAGAVFNGVFCLRKIRWQDNPICHFMGVLVVISSEASVFTVVILTSFRLYAVYKPFAASTKPKLPTTFLLLFTVWLIAILLGLLPLSGNLEHIFTDKILLRDKMFFQNLTVSLQSAKTWVEKTLTFDPQMNLACSIETLEKIANARSWQTLSDILGNSTAGQYFKPVVYFGYYGTNSPCIPELFVTRDDQFWQYSFTLVTINFIAFVYVACAYAFIIFEVRQGSNDKNNFDPRRTNEVIGMQKKIYRLVISNFCCWVPIAVLVFVNFSGVQLAEISYSVTSIVLLPINSAFDPIIYSNVIDLLSDKIRGLRKKHRKEFVPKTISETADTKI